VAILAAFAGGLVAWTFVEYVIHAWLSHTFTTFATPFHNEHHRDPRKVFAIRMWLPLALTWLLALAVWGGAVGVIFYSGILTGFAAYEWLHYRIHFAVPSGRWESWLRTRHLIHHSHAAGRGFGVTNSLWDIAFGSDLNRAVDWVYAEEAARTPPLSGSSNMGRILRFNLEP
jgi:dihydroceramide fatty acyl 2-hydroxylase